MIGIIGGIGPVAGINLASRVIHYTTAGKDQDHFPMILLAVPSEVSDRTEFLMGRSSENPGYALARQVLKLEDAGATVAGMACNTAHAPAIINVVKSELERANSRIRLLHVIEETMSWIQNRLPDCSTIGILGTDGTYHTRLYAQPLIQAGKEISDPGSEQQHAWIHEAIYHVTWGIKATGTAISQQSIDLLNKAVLFYKDQGADALLLACSEITLAIDKVNCMNMNIIRPMDILAEALIREFKKTTNFVA